MPNNSRADVLNLSVQRNRGEGVIEGVRENTHYKFGNKNSCRFSEEYISGMLEEIFPRNYKVAISSSEWDHSEKVSTVLNQKSKQLEFFLKVISCKKSHRALEMLIRIINRCPFRKTMLCSKEDKVHRQMVSSLKGFVCHLTHKGTTATDEKDALHTIITACSRDIPETEENAVRELLGISKKAWYGQSNLPNAERYQHKSQKEKMVSDLVRRQRQSILGFCHSEEASHIDSNSR